jgi:hypothetical protein
MTTTLDELRAAGRLKIEHGCRITFGRWGHWFEKDRVLLDGREIGERHTERFYKGKDRGHYFEVHTVCGDTRVEGGDLDWLLRVDAERQARHRAAEAARKRDYDHEFMLSALSAIANMHVERGNPKVGELAALMHSIASVTLSQVKG